MCVFERERERERGRQAVRQTEETVRATGRKEGKEKREDWQMFSFFQFSEFVLYCSLSSALCFLKCKHSRNLLLLLLSLQLLLFMFQIWIPENAASGYWQVNSWECCIWLLTDEDDQISVYDFSIDNKQSYLTNFPSSMSTGLDLSLLTLLLLPEASLPHYYYYDYLATWLTQGAKLVGP